jgi:DNA end-binding protein Ku
MVGLGRLTLARRERMVMLEPRGAGLILITLRAAEEVRSADFGRYEGELDAEAVAIAAMIIKRKTGAFDPATFRDRYQEALRELIEAKMKGLPVKTRPVIQPRPMLDLMAALKSSLAQEPGEPPATPKRRRAAADKRQRNLLLPVTGGVREEQSPTVASSNTRVAERRRERSTRR